jgi:hypothetical protein
MIEGIKWSIITNKYGNDVHYIPWICEWYDVHAHVHVHLHLHY